MIFRELEIPGVYRIEPEPHADERGRFARTWCEHEFAEAGIDFRPTQGNLSFNRRRATLRGLHFQRPPHGEAKLIRCSRGAAFVAVADLRPGSPTRGRWVAERIDADGAVQVFVPEGTANGFQTLSDDTEILYLMSCPHVPEAASGCRWDDPDLGIEWPLEPSVVSERDRLLPTLRELEP